MGERGEEGEIWKKHTEHCMGFLLQYLSACSQTLDMCMILQTYGSAAEDLKSIAPDDVGDFDIVICPKSDDLMIHNEMIEYSENPMHVKIKGADHPILHSCLVEGTEYVATSALKNFHSAIYGRSASHQVNRIVRALQIMSREKFASYVWRCKNNEFSPALQIDFTQSFGPISEEVERLKNTETLINIDFSEWEFFVHEICKFKGINYSREHADVLKEYFGFANELQMSYCEKGLLCRPESFPLLFQELQFSDRVKDFRDRIREIESRTQNESRGNDQLAEAAERKTKPYVRPGICYDNERGRREENVSQETLRTKQESSVVAQNFEENQRSTEDFTFTLSHEKLEKTLQKSPGNQMPKQSNEGNENGNDKSDQNENEHGDPKSESQREPHAGQQPSAGEPDPPKAVVEEPNGKDGYEEEWKMENRLTEHLFKPVTEEAKPASTKDSPKAPIVGGCDLVPALRSQGGTGVDETRAQMALARHSPQDSSRWVPFGDQVTKEGRQSGMRL